MKMVRAGLAFAILALATVPALAAMPKSIAWDGKPNGELNKAVSDAVNIPVIASGGAGELDHLYDAVVEGGADAVLMASITHFGDFTINQMKEYLRNRGLPMNL